MLFQKKCRNYRIWLSDSVICFSILTFYNCAMVFTQYSQQLQTKLSFDQCDSGENNDIKSGDKFIIILTYDMSRVLVVLVLFFYSFLPLFSCLAKHFNNLSFDYKLWECCHIIDCTNKCMFIVNIYLFIFSNLMSSDDSYSDTKKNEKEQTNCCAILKKNLTNFHTRTLVLNWAQCKEQHFLNVTIWGFFNDDMYKQMYEKLTEISE